MTPRSPRLRAPRLKTTLAAILFTAAATMPAALPGAISTTSAALVYVLAVVGASATAGLGAGLAASVLSFLTLNFFFTPPLHTFSVDKAEDLVALVVFLLVSGIVGTLLSRAVSQRARATRREQEAILLQHFSTRLLSGQAAEEVLGSFARALTELLDLARCEIGTELTAEPVIAAGRAGHDPPPETERIPIVAGNRDVGHILVVPASSPLRPEERNVINTFAGQIGLALEGMRLAEDAAQARLEAERSRLQAALFSSVTHDLRTPLASITASVTSLLDTDARFAPEDRRDLLETIRHQADRLNRLVGNLLDLSRMRAGALTPAKSPAAIDEVIEGVVARLQPLLDGHDVRLMFRDDLPAVPMDVVQIDQVVTNLVENAAKFSPPGSEISISAARWQDAVEVRIADRGPGVSPRERERVFEPFIRGETGGGTGLGLSIARAIVESHGGKIWIEAAPGGGTTLVFQLPLGR